MSRINLLPWREWERERRNRAFFARLGASGAAALIVMLLAGQYLDHLAARQEQRADAREARLRELDARIARVADLGGQAERLQARIAVLQGLHAERSTLARVLYALARTAPSGAHYEGLSRTGDVIMASGAAESAARISALMRRLAASKRFGMPTLRSIHEDPDNAAYGGRAVRFDLAFAARGPSLEGQGAEGPRPERTEELSDGGIEGLRDSGIEG